jgi:hypothetical protein
MKLKIILMLIIKLKNIFAFNTLKLIYDYFFFGDKDKKLFTLPCFHPTCIKKVILAIELGN